MTNTRVLVTGATGKIGGAVAAQLLEKGVSTRALVHRDDARAARLRALGAEVVVADMLDILQVQAAVDGVDRLFFNPPYHPYALDSAMAFAVAARRSGVQAVVALGQWLSSPCGLAQLTRAGGGRYPFRRQRGLAQCCAERGQLSNWALMRVPFMARIGSMHQGPGRHAHFQQLGGHGAADLARGPRYQYTRVCHWSFLPESDLISRRTAEPARRVDYLRGKRLQI